MNVVLVSLAGVIGALFLWGVLSPRTQWYALVGWTRSNPHATEPGSGAYSVSRFISLIGLLVLLTLAVGWLVGGLRPVIQGVARASSPVDRVWGQPRSLVVDRVFMPGISVPEGLVEAPVTGYQIVYPASRAPAYLFAAESLRTTGLAAEPGFLGVEPISTAVALDTADLVVHVVADDRCIPQQVIALVGDDGTIKVGVYFGQPNPADGSNADNVASCDATPSAAHSQAFLIPIDFATTLGSRELQSLDGTAIEAVAPPA